VDYLKAGREIAIDGRLLFDEFRTDDGGYASRGYIIAERVEFLTTRNRPTGQATEEASPQESAAPSARPATPASPDHHRGPATTAVAGPQTFTPTTTVRDDRHCHRHTGDRDRRRAAGDRGAVPRRTGPRRGHG
jgi:single-stranded DNA-binding protein